MNTTSIEYKENKDRLREESIFLLSHKTSKFYEDRFLLSRLVTAVKVFYPKFELHTGCSGCVGKAYHNLRLIYNYSFINKMMEDQKNNTGNYRLLPKNEGHRFKKAIITNGVSEALRKQVYHSHESRAALFDPESIPKSEENTKKPSTKKADK